MTSAPSVKDYTESEITDERITEGQCHIYFGYVLMLFACIVFSTSMWAYGDESIEAKVQRMVKYRTLVESYESRNFESFRYNLQPNAKVLNKFYLFHIMNGEDFLDGKVSSPSFVEKGPYVYKEFMLRAHIEFSADKNQISYRTMVKQEYIPDEMWDVKETDEIAMVDPTYVKAMWNTPEKMGLRGEENLIMTKTAAKVKEITNFFRESNGGSKVNGLVEKYYLADMLPGKFFADIMQELWDYLRNMSGSGDSGCALRKWYYQELTSNGEQSGFLMKWGGRCAARSGCISSSRCKAELSSEGEALLDLLDPYICNNPDTNSGSIWIPGFDDGSCEDSAGYKMLFNGYSLELFTPEMNNHGSFMDDYFDWEEGNGPLGPHRWLDQDDAYKWSMIDPTYKNILNENIYNKIRSWLQKMVSNDRFFKARLNTKFRTWDGHDPGRNWAHAATLQWANGRILGRGNGVRSFYDNQVLVGNVDDRSTETVKDIRSDYRKQEYAETSGAKYTEFGVWMDREMSTSVGSKVYLDVDESNKLIEFLGDVDGDTGFWAMYGNGVYAGADHDGDKIPGTNDKITVKMARAYVEYIKDTFVTPNYDKNGLIRTKTASEWILGFDRRTQDSLVTEIVDSGDPRRNGGMIGSQDFPHPRDEPDDDDAAPPVDDEACVEERGDNVGSCDPLPECRVEVDRGYGGVVLDFDKCEKGEEVILEDMETSGKKDLLVDPGAWYKKKNTYKTGYHDVRKRGQIVEIAGQDRLPAELFGKEVVFETGGKDLIGPASPCNGLTDGFSYPPMNDLTMCGTLDCKIAQYHPDTSAVIVLKVRGEGTIMGQSCKELVIDEEYLVNTEGGLANPYHDSWNFVSRDRPGLVDISGSQGAPMFLSKPHFYSNGEGGLNFFERYGLAVSGLSPSAELHESSVWVEISTGIPVQTNLRLQYNILLPPGDGILSEFSGAGLEEGDAVILPVYWMDREGRVNGWGGELMNTHPIYALYWIEYTLLPLSIMFTMGLIAGGLFCVRRGGWMKANPSMRVNEAGMRYHKWMFDIHKAKQQMSESLRKERKERNELEKRIRAGLRPSESTVGISSKKHHADTFTNTTSPFHTDL